MTYRSILPFSLFMTACLSGSANPEGIQTATAPPPGAGFPYKVKIKFYHPITPNSHRCLPICRGVTSLPFQNAPYSSTGLAPQQYALPLM